MHDEAINMLKEQSQKMGIELTEEQLEKFSIYMNFLIEYNEITNLTAIKEPNQIVIKHFLDSLLLTKTVDLNGNKKMIDIGTGAGFPGVPVKIKYPNVKLTLLDSLNKRLVFLSKLSEKIGLDYEVIHKRAEECGKDKNYREKFDYVTSRAVASLNILAGYCLPYLKVGGIFIALKGPNAEEETVNAKNAIKEFGGKIIKTQYFELPDGSGKRSIILIEKIKKTPEMYSRVRKKIIT